MYVYVYTMLMLSGGGYCGEGMLRACENAASRSYRKEKEKRCLLRIIYMPLRFLVNFERDG